jgi:hypothetical protein
MTDFEEKKKLLQEYKEEIQVKYQLLQEAKEGGDTVAYWVLFKDLMELCNKSMQTCYKVLSEIKDNIEERKLDILKLN